MATKTCDMCGRKFEGGANSRTCDACKHVKCPVCGEEMHLKGPKLTKYKEQGWVTCGKQSCAKEMTRRNLLAREGITNVSQRKDVREKLREVRARDSEETKAKRSQSLRESCSRPEVAAKRAKTNMERHGYGFALQDSDIQKRASDLAAAPESRAKAKGTMVEKYGVTSPFNLPGVRERAISSTISPEAREKARQSCMERYGVDNPLKLPEVREAMWSDEARRKRIETSLEHFGTEHPLQSEEVKRKIRATSQERYGAPTYMQSEEGKQALRDARAEKWGDPSVASETYGRVKAYHDEHPKASISEVAAALGYEDHVVYGQNSRHDIGIPTHRSYMEDMMARALDGMGLSYVRRDRTGIAPMELDFYIPERKVAVEVNDKLTHNEQCSPFGMPKTGRYHRDKAALCVEAGIRLVHAYEFEFDREGGWDRGLLDAVRSLAMPREGVMNAEYDVYRLEGCDDVLMGVGETVVARVGADMSDGVLTLSGWAQESPLAPPDWESRLAVGAAMLFDAKVCRSVLDTDRGAVGYVPEGARLLDRTPPVHDYGDGFTVGLCGKYVYEWEA